MIDGISMFCIGFSMCGIIGCWIIWRLRNKLEEVVNRIEKELKKIIDKIDNLK